MSLNVVTLEMSLKPFRNPRNFQDIETVCHTAFTQWNTLCQHADRVQILLWPADGSEILAYKGDLNESFEWAYWLGMANAHLDVPNDPNKVSLFSTPQHYMDNPPTQTYHTLKTIVDTLKRIGNQITGKPIHVGATFDPGGEFARSTFKYKDHPEICIANTIGANSFVGCYATLNADPTPYAGFPKGIPQDTTFGTFFGKQAQAFLTDLNFDYIWLSNGFGFGLETWSTVGPLFDGSTFDAQNAPQVREKILGFWKDFRNVCPDFPIETRGTNLSTGTDLASDAVPLREIYESNFNMYTPPNSPWAAIDGDFGLELMGYLSRIAQVSTGKGFPFRFYVHDPWWINSPWLDRYGRDAHDIQLPMSVCRIDDQGKAQTHNAIQLLTIDDSYGQMPQSCPNEITPIMQRCLETKPDEAGLLTWVYPFDTFHDYVTQSPDRLNVAYFNDWFIRGAINNGLPLNTVVSDRALTTSLASNPTTFNHTILLSLVPDANSPLETALRTHINRGGKVLFYGPIDHASDAMRSKLNLRMDTPLEGQVQVTLANPLDHVIGNKLPTQMIHRSLYCAGPMAETLQNTGDSDTQILASIGDRPIALTQGSQIAWVRGSNCTDMSEKPKLPTSDDPTQYMQGDVLLRHALRELGLHVSFTRQDLSHRNPVLTASRHDNAIWFSGYAKNSTAQWELAFPNDGGMPLMVQCDAIIKEGKAVYQMPRAWRRECRVLVTQHNGVVSCSEEHS
ncbi:MAG: hypothetical protein JKX85_01575, partial [Phycisphaeraceae bacterium]|nr:hypothetical protein [Phycisphaeraceae bacterium]